MVYLVIYECLSIEFNYDVTEEIKTLAVDFMHPANNTWFITSELSLEDISKRLQDKMTNLRNERLMVITLNRENHRKGWMPKVMWKWLNIKLI